MRRHWEGAFCGGKHTSFWATPARCIKASVIPMAVTLCIRSVSASPSTGGSLIWISLGLRSPRNVYDVLGKVRGGLRDGRLDSRDTCIPVLLCFASDSLPCLCPFWRPMDGAIRSWLLLI